MLLFHQKHNDFYIGACLSLEMNVLKLGFTVFKDSTYNHFWYSLRISILTKLCANYSKKTWSLVVNFSVLYLLHFSTVHILVFLYQLCMYFYASIRNSNLFFLP